MMAKILVLSGAGISQPSGIQTFRGSNGLWNGHDVMAVSSADALERTPDIVNAFFHERWVDMRDAKPNSAHKAIAAMEEAHQVLVLTQNIDVLHEAAGSTEVFHLHGRIDRVDSADGYIPRTDGMDLTGTRPDVVLFGEQLPSLEYAVNRIEEFAPDEVWIVGTTMLVHPFAGLARFAQIVAKKNKTPIRVVIFDKEPHLVRRNAKIHDFSPRETIVLKPGSADKTVPEYCGFVF